MLLKTNFYLDSQKISHLTISQMTAAVHSKSSKVNCTVQNIYNRREKAVSIAGGHK